MLSVEFMNKKITNLSNFYINRKILKQILIFSPSLRWTSHPASQALKRTVQLMHKLITEIFTDSPSFRHARSGSSTAAMLPEGVAVVLSGFKECEDSSGNLNSQEFPDSHAATNNDYSNW